MGKHRAGDAPGQDAVERGWIALALMLWGDHRRPEWHTRAACRGSDPGLWEERTGQSLRAQRICAGCPVRQDCQWDAEVWETVTARRITDVSVIVGGETAAQRAHRYVRSRLGVRISG